MKFRPCIDIHNGKVKQIVGGSLRDEGDRAQTNFSSEMGAAFYAEMYRKDGLKGGHIILLNHPDSEYFCETKRQAEEALGLPLLHRMRKNGSRLTAEGRKLLEAYEEAERAAWAAADAVMERYFGGNGHEGD